MELDIFSLPHIIDIVQRLLQQSGFAKRTFTDEQRISFFPCPTGTFVNASIKDWPSCERCPPGKFFAM